jgi:hypothetical protein
MKRFLTWQVMLGCLLVSLSVIFYVVHYLIFRDLHHIFLYLIGDIAFLFIDVLIVMLVLHRLLMFREKQLIMKKVNMVIGTFFSEVGTELLSKCIRFDAELSQIGKQLLVNSNWKNKDFNLACRQVQCCESSINSKRGNLGEMKSFLVARRQFLLGLLENPNLLEHEKFSNLLWAVFHLTDELAHRSEFKELPEADWNHLSGDIKRVYHQLVLQWLDYMQHLSRDYPYLFSLAVRMNPFDEHSSVIVK